MPIVEVGDAPEVLAIIPTLGDDPSRLTACVESIARSTGPLRIGVLCVLNSSTVAPFDLPGATVEVVGLNLGWAGGLAFGVSLVDSPLLWFVQDDMTVEPDTLAHLHASLIADETLGVVGPVAVDGNGLVAPYSCGSLISAHGVMSNWYPRQPTPVDELAGLDQLGYLPSRGMLVRRTAYTAVGGANVRLYPVQFVDVDFCLRLSAAGWRFRMVPEALIRHAGKGSTPSAFAEFLHSRNAQTLKQDWFADSRETTERFVATAALRPDAVSAPHHRLHPGLDGDLLEAVAQSAADALIHLGRVYTAALRGSPPAAPE